ncbi:hypothetical protein HYU45_03545 [Candidatus Daviesbacteria bacterium]|nr:hypothetical protein [Candidatus Daviesbacteria bacterium]
MDIEKKLKDFKRIYQATEPSGHFLEHGWQDLQDKKRQLELIGAKRSLFYLRPFATATLMVFILAGVLGGVVRASQNSLPGEVLYPVKRISEEVASTVSGNKLIKVEGRANDIVELSRKGRNSKRIQKAVGEYKTAVAEASRSGKNIQKIEKTLEDQEKEFESVKKGPQEEEINEAIEISRSGRDEQRQDEEDKVEEEDRSGSDSGEK